MPQGSASPFTSAGTPSAQNRNEGMRTRVLLILAMALITTGTTLVSLLAIRRPLRNLMVENVTSDLLHSLATFENLRSQRMADLNRENALLADLPSLKALMTTSDERTIADGAVEFWKVSGADLFALADPSGNIMAAFVAGTTADTSFRADLHKFVATRQASYLVSGNRLFGCSVQPLYFGSRMEGTLLGYVISGFAIDHAAVEKLSRATNVDAAFIKDGRLIASSLAGAYEKQLPAVPAHSVAAGPAPYTISLAHENFLAVSQQLGAPESALALVELKSLDQEERVVRQTDRLVLLAGLLALLLGTALMVLLSQLMTRPLEQLAAGVRAFGSGDNAHLLPYRGTREVRELSAAFASMRREIVQANQALLESERLATIGRMASSVSHDLRHYLAAVYANSEFLAAGRLPEAERNEILAEIRTAVNGTTEMLESLLMFSRTGSTGTRNPHSISALVEKAVNIARAHPDAVGVAFSVEPGRAEHTEILADAKQIERAIYNLLLNSCQAPRRAGMPSQVSISVTAHEQEISIDVADNGEGVPAEIRNTLFEPFVSEGKHKGSGLGLTLTQSIAADHGGGVVLVSSRPGETIFRMCVARGSSRAPSAFASHARTGGS